MAEAITKRDYKEWEAFCEKVQNSNAVKFNEGKKDQDKRIKRCLKSYNDFVKEYFKQYADHDCADFHIRAANAILKDKDILAVLEWAREHAKSVHACIIIPMWLIAHGELTGMILMGKNNDDACNLLSDIQAQLQFNELFAHDFGKQYNFGSWEDGDFTTVDGIRFLAVGRNQSPRGARKGEKRPNYAVIDDIDDDEIIYNPKRVDKVIRNIMGALYFALSIKGARMVVAGNRIHHNSILANMVGDTKKGGKKREGIYHSKVCALKQKTIVRNTDGQIIGGTPSWSRYTLKQILEKMKKAGHVLAMQEFFHQTEVEGKIFKNAYFRWARMPRLQKMNVIVGYFDPSFVNSATSDYKAVRLWGIYNNKKWCIKSFVRRCELEEAFRWMIQVEKNLPNNVAVIWYIEKQFINKTIKRSQRIVERELKYKLNIQTDHRIKPNKYTRMVRMEPDYSNGGVYYNADEKDDPDMIDGNDQLKQIEPGYNTPDDSPDADEGAWYYLDFHYDEESFDPVIGEREIDEDRRY
ncbi:hypothetical protein QWY81_17855 [Polaribacter undariae]|uniref:Uncharacterized protein n=1 Tax=Polaribacter sejongensis TaxID=985043 RepID=A0AAJ1R007_9FLAO|nr:hypothetical protein [Polaribacter undariae]MDN3621337.1 hypothetical protein [Polaribacter undariae]UWD31879.1 hypothetical protein NQP51_17320 [Polaribacter undariae]